MKLFYFLLCLSYVNSFRIHFSAIDKIIGGQVKRITDVPYQASFEYENKHRCGATIISKSWLVSAGHCFHGISEIPIKGKVRIATSRKNADGQLLNISRVVVYPDYNHEEYDNDIALIQVSPEIQFNKNKKAIDIVRSNAILQDGQLLNISGFGQSTLEHNVRSQVLKGATVRIIEDLTCAKAYRFFDSITNSMFCAESLPNDACAGDSGGPAVINGKLAGVISNGLRCATGRFPGIYTKVHRYHDWINKYVNESNL